MEKLKWVIVGVTLPLFLFVLNEIVVKRQDTTDERLQEIDDRLRRVETAPWDALADHENRLRLIEPKVEVSHKISSQLLDALARRFRVDAPVSARGSLPEPSTPGEDEPEPEEDEGEAPRIEQHPVSPRDLRGRYEK